MHHKVERERERDRKREIDRQRNGKNVKRINGTDERKDRIIHEKKIDENSSET